MPIFKQLSGPLRLIRRAGRKFSASSPLVKLALGSGLALVLVAAYLVLGMFFLSRGELALAALHRSYHENALCRETCWQQRAVLAKSVASELANRPDGRSARRLRYYFQAEEASLAWRTALVDICLKAFGAQNPPDFLADYAAKTDSDPRLVARLISVFDPAALSGQSETANPLDYYFQQLENSSRLEIVEAAILGISRYPDRASVYEEGQVEIISQLILSPDTDERLRPALVMLLGEYYELWSDATSEALRWAYSDTELDEVSRLFSADLLNRFEPQGGPEGGEWPLPAVSNESWEKYYER